MTAMEYNSLNKIRIYAFELIRIKNKEENEALPWSIMSINKYGRIGMMDATIMGWKFDGEQDIYSFKASPTDYILTAKEKQQCYSGKTCWVQLKQVINQ